VAKLNMGQKAERVLKLALGMRLARVVAALRDYGFTEADRELGWSLLKALTLGKLSYKPVTKQDPELIQQLDTWENRWFPIAAASLRTRFPDVYAWLFLNLAQTEGPEVVVSVGTFVNRLERMASEAGPQGAAARTLLVDRGLTVSTVEVAQDLLKKLGTTSIEPVVSDDPQAQIDAENAMWDWYLEWSEIARVAIKDRKLLRELGFLSVKRRKAAGEEEEEVSEDEAAEDAEDAAQE
jgi:hypothetical protein